MLCMQNHEGGSIHLQFEGVRNLNIRTGPYIDIPIVGLVCDDMRGDQWPGVNLRVSSEDGGTHLSFYCTDAHMVSVEGEAGV